MKFKKIFLIALNSINLMPIQADNGGSVAAGVLGGLAVGGIIGAASRPRREVVYMEQPSYRPLRKIDLTEWEIRLNEWQERLSEEETLLSNRARNMAKKDKELRDREKRLMQKDKELKNREINIIRREKALKERDSQTSIQENEK